MDIAQDPPPQLPSLDTVSLERDGHVLLIGLNRPHKRNSFDRAMLADLARIGPRLIAGKKADITLVLPAGVATKLIQDADGIRRQDLVPGHAVEEHRHLSSTRNGARFDRRCSLDRRKARI